MRSFSGGSREQSQGDALGYDVGRRWRPGCGLTSSGLFMTLKRRTTNEERRTGGLPAAFTLIEVLVAMTVLSVMVLMVANIFQSSSAAWNIGTQKADMNTAARAALDFMARELACAVAGPIETVAVGANSALKFNLVNGNDVRFVSLLGEPGGTSRALQLSLFRYQNNILQYYRETDAFNPYVDSLDWRGGAMLITNVVSLQISAFTNEYGLDNGLFTENFDSSTPGNLDQLPLCVDIALEMLSDDDMLRFNQLSGIPQTEFKNRNAKLYSTRIYFPNRVGYGGH